MTIQEIEEAAKNTGGPVVHLALKEALKYLRAAERALVAETDGRLGEKEAREAIQVHL